MSRLEELIQTHCPDGVKFVPLEQVLDYYQPTPYIVKSILYDDSYDMPVLTAGASFILGYTNEKKGIYNASQEKPVIIFDDFTTSFHWVDFKFKVKSSAMKILTETKQKPAILRYVFYAMQCIQYQPSQHARQWIHTYSKIQIPLPPLPVQEEIVRILDTFTALETELEAELSARTKQYEHYSHKLLFLSQNSSENISRLIRLGDIAHYSKERISAKEIDKTSYVGVDNILQNKKGKVDSDYVPISGTLIKYQRDDILIGNIRPYLRKIWIADRDGGTNGDVLCLQINKDSKQSINPKYLFHILASEEFFTYAIKNSRGAKMPRGDKTLTLKFEFPLPHLSVQEEIVSILDRFDALVNDLKSGLPAEIALRRKQYEYYRNKLLTFKPIQPPL